MLENLREFRESAGLTQAELANKVGISRTQITKWENGIQTPSTLWIEKLAKAFGKSPVELISFKSSAPAPSKSDKVAKDISIACVTVINDLLNTKKMKPSKADRVIEKAIWYFWNDFASGTPPSLAQIKKYMLSIIG